MRLDLHMHSAYSDGEDSPERLAEMCRAAGVTLAALTDHDTVSGVEEFLAACRERGIRAIPGIELSAIRHKEVHVLGYAIEYRDPGFVAELQRIKDLRNRRNAEILKVLNKNGVYLFERDIAPQDRETVGRMHIARAMKKRGYVASVGEAFDRWLGHGKRAYVPAYRLTPEQAVRLIAAYGGRAVLAHPMKLNLGGAELYQLAADLKECGLMGIEAYYVSHTKEESGMLRKLADDLGLVATCGSDYHGSGRVACLGGVENPLREEDLAPLL